MVENYIIAKLIGLIILPLFDTLINLNIMKTFSMWLNHMLDDITFIQPNQYAYFLEIIPYKESSVNILGFRKQNSWRISLLFRLMTKSFEACIIFQSNTTILTRYFDVSKHKIKRKPWKDLFWRKKPPVKKTCIHVFFQISRIFVTQTFLEILFAHEIRNLPQIIVSLLGGDPQGLRSGTF